MTLYHVKLIATKKKIYGETVICNHICIEINRIILISDRFALPITEKSAGHLHFDRFVFKRLIKTHRHF